MPCITVISASNLNKPKFPSSRYWTADQFDLIGDGRGGQVSHAVDPGCQHRVLGL